jgi:hypothetical protein
MELRLLKRNNPLWDEEDYLHGAAEQKRLCCNFRRIYIAYVKSKNITSGNLGYPRPGYMKQAELGDS